MTFIRRHKWFPAALFIILLLSTIQAGDKRASNINYAKSSKQELKASPFITTTLVNQVETHQQGVFHPVKLFFHSISFVATAHTQQVNAFYALWIKVFNLQDIPILCLICKLQI